MKAAAAAPAVYYQDKGFLITSSKAKSPRKTYRVDKIEKVSLRRDPYFILFAFTVFLSLFLLKFGRFVTPPVYLFLLICMSMTFFSRRFGLLFITSKAVSELAFLGLYSRLEDVREAIEKAMHKEDHDSGLAATDDDEAEDDDDDD